MKFKSILGFCSYKGCKSRYEFELEVKTGEKRKWTRLCEEHTKELIKYGKLKSITF